MEINDFIQVIGSNKALNKKLAKKIKEEISKKVVGSRFG